MSTLHAKPTDSLRARTLPGNVLDVRDLTVSFPTRNGPIQVVDSVNLTIGSGEILGLVGESGSGKSMLARAVLGMVARPGRVTAGEIMFDELDLLKQPSRALRHIRGDRIALVPQEPMTSMNPTFTVATQLTEVLRTHRPEMRNADRIGRAVQLMEQVGIQFPAERLRQYPHELSGGIRQRLMIAMALICGNVELLIADEPTTALDVTIQAQILDLFVQLQGSRRMSILLITHDLGVVAQTAHRVAVMYAGEIVEVAAVEPLFEAPLHPYTRGLLESLPRRGTTARKSNLASIPGTVPVPTPVKVGCQFNDRCVYANGTTCRTQRPLLEEADAGRWVRCHRWRDLPPFALSAGLPA